MGDGNGNLIDVTGSNFIAQPRQETHHGESNIYLRDFDNDGDLIFFTQLEILHLICMVHT